MRSTASPKRQSRTQSPAAWQCDADRHRPPDIHDPELMKSAARFRTDKRRRKLCGTSASELFRRLATTGELRNNGQPATGGPCWHQRFDQLVSGIVRCLPFMSSSVAIDSLLILPPARDGSRSTARLSGIVSDLRARLWETPARILETARATAKTQTDPEPDVLVLGLPDKEARVSSGSQDWPHPTSN